MGDENYRDVPRGNIRDAPWEAYPEFGGSEWVLYRSDDGKRVVAAWQEAGKHTFTYPFDEFVYVIRGSAKVVVHGGETFEIAEGDIAYFKEGVTVDFDMSEDFMDVTCLVSDRRVEWR